ncbi:hypothetical protein HMF8227_01461 [Saliniradius amylolyticus]|uniref:Uncharacterized protein n=1 Tax=Saliniradius amylolyticus TaxID=2183582 RepID=A0A2S2E2P9_9ALTE|nr:hypothetical protein HMF8227_01461 [Saliniradius amylolyticus]
MNRINGPWLVTTIAGAVIGAVVVYQLRKHTSGIVDD